MALSASSCTVRVPVAPIDTLVIVFRAFEIWNGKGELGGIGSDAVAANAGVIKSRLKCQRQLCSLVCGGILTGSQLFSSGVAVALIWSQIKGQEAF